MEHKFEWNKDLKELVEIRIGNELTTQTGEKVEGRFENKTIYTEKSSREMIMELRRQLKDKQLELNLTKKSIEKIEKTQKPVDRVFFEKFKTCMAKMGMQQQKDSLIGGQEQLTTLTEQLDELKEAMKEDF